MGRPAPRSIPMRLVVDGDHYAWLIQDAIAKAQVSVWIATANLKELRVEAPIGTAARARGRWLSILDTFGTLLGRRVDLRVLHGGLPSRAFRGELARRPQLKRDGLQLRQCPRVHLKIVAVDGKLLYLGSANFTGAGLGGKSDGRRNFEMGMITDDDVLLDTVQARFDRIWTGGECGSCKIRGLCPAPLDRPRRAT